MGEALLWGAIAGAANLLGAVAVLLISLPKRLIGYIMALGTGALIAAVSYDLLEEAMKLSGLKDLAFGFLGGAILFTVLDMLVNRKGAQHRKRSGEGSASPDASGSGMAIFIGTIMDAIPETAMIGLSLINGGVNPALITAIFISNFPEGLSSTSGLLKGGFSKRKVIMMWMLVLAASALSALAGYVFLDHASDSTKALLRSFAAGGIIAMIASTMAPEAYEKGGPLVGFITAAGIFLTLLL
ncbi:ZIP family metal transporter [Bacillus badius]|uniref:Membrane protein n=1 Tax=Bacillus badius TaxID=1455 RepID=A0ABR5AUL8_BACBA|nr:membrane protein [Bacillus badius]KIL78404.1 membrane protein [Bacillus badius]MED4716062.1 ZIP family metal transporter [Bacillus badius]